MLRRHGEWTGVREQTDTFVLEKTFRTDKTVGRAAVYATALGLYVAEINGRRVGDAYLTPGWTSYDKTLQYQTYDVSDYVKSGENSIRITVNGGWFCGVFNGRRRTLYGRQAAALACLHIRYEDGTDFFLATGPDWTARESVIRRSSLFDGEEWDDSRNLAPLSACRVAFGREMLVPQQCEPVRNIVRIPAERRFTTPAGETVYDFGQNLTGVAEVRTTAAAYGTITLRFAEILDEKGNFYTDNYGGAKAVDRFFARGETVFLPEFTYRGFRYMRIEGDCPPPENVTAVVRHTDMRRTGHIVTSDARFNRLLDNVVWGLRGNFLDVPTDCPQRDERLGWTGDANVFCNTAAFLYDVRGLYGKWLRSVRDDRDDAGRIPIVAPDVLGAKQTAALWCDSIVMTPWKLYEVYGDSSFLKDNYPAMRQYLSACAAAAKDGLIAEGPQFGDWLALDGATPLGGNAGATDPYFIANVLYAHCLRLAAEIADILGDGQARREYLGARAKLLSRIRSAYFTAGGRIACETVTALTLALTFDAAPPRHRAAVAARLNERVCALRCRIPTGFAGTPYLLFALADNGYADTAGRVLMNSSFPGWLYEVDMGATTVWERWNGLSPDGRPHPDSRMNSFNHYAYGTVAEYVYRRVAGLDCLSPGYRKVRIAPIPTRGLTSVRAQFDSAAGRIECGYRQEGEVLTVFATVPDKVSAEIVLPDGRRAGRGHGTFSYRLEWPSLALPPFTRESNVGDILSNPRTAAAFTAAFSGFADVRGKKWTHSDTVGQTLDWMIRQKELSAADGEEILRRANDTFERYARSFGKTGGRDAGGGEI